MVGFEKIMLGIGIISCSVYALLGAGALFIISFNTLRDYYNKTAKRRIRLRLEDSDDINTRRELIKYRNKIDLRLSKMGE